MTSRRRVWAVNWRREWTCALSVNSQSA